jgi:hypothetical protein
MIVCPSCGYSEQFFWKNSPHQLFMQYLNPEEAQEFLAEHPELAAALQQNRKYAELRFYAFRITKTGHLHRQPKSHCVAKKWNHYSHCYENAARAGDRARRKKLNKKITQFVIVEAKKRC